MNEVIFLSKGNRNKIIDKAGLQPGTVDELLEDPGPAYEDGTPVVFHVFPDAQFKWGYGPLDTLLEHNTFDVEKAKTDFVPFERK